MLLAFHQDQFVLLNFFFSVHFIDIWSFDHIQPVMESIIESGDIKEILKFLDSRVAKHLFNGFEEEDKYPFINRFLNIKNMVEDIDDILKQRPYSPYYLMHLIQRGVFRKLENMVSFFHTIESIKDYHLERLYQRPQNVSDLEKFWKLMAVLPAEDIHKNAAETLLKQF